MEKRATSYPRKLAKDAQAELNAALKENNAILAGAGPHASIIAREPTDASDATHSMAFSGCLDHAELDRIIGWAWSPGQPAERLLIDILFNDTAVATVKADRYRADLKAAGIGDGRYGFEWNPKISDLPEDGCTVTLRRAGTFEVLNGRWSLTRSGDDVSSTATAADVEYVGTIDQAEPYRITGSAWCPARPSERVIIDLLLNGTSLATLRCDEFRQELKDARMGDGRHSFSWVPDPSLMIPGSYTIAARVAGTTNIITKPCTMLYRPPALIDGAVNLAGENKIAGWAWNKLRPMNAISVGLFEGDNLLLSTCADEYDPKLAAEGVGNGMHAFSLRLPSFFDRKPRVFSVRALPSCVELAGSPLAVEPRPGRETSLQPSTHNLDPTQTNETLIEAVSNFIADFQGSIAIPNLEAYRNSCLDALVYLYRGAQGSDGRPIIFPEFEAPLISIIIPVYNQFSYTWRCLKSVAVATWGLSFEVILIDDCSDDETPTLRDRVPGLRYVRQEKNKHFILSCNRGAGIARGKYIYFLNNDVELTANAIRALLQTFEDFPTAGVVGSKLIYPNGNLQEVGCILFDTGDAHNVGRHEQDPLLPNFRYLRECHYVSAASLMIPRELFKQIGGFDERYLPAYCEDSDLCMSVRALGKKVFVQPMSVVVHYERVSADASAGKATSNLMKQNHPKFIAKWGTILASHPRADEPWDIVKEVGITRRCLFFDWRTPRTDEDAGSYAALQEMRILRSLGIKVTFASLQMDYAGRHTEALQRVGIECAYAPHYKNWLEFIEKRGGEFDLIYGMRYNIIEQVIEQMRSQMPKAKILFNCADFHFIRTLREAQLKKKVGDPKADEMFAEAQLVKERELDVMRRSDCIIVYNAVEREVVEASLPGRTAIVMPWIVPVRDKIPPWSERQGIAFLGSYQHVPNRDAVEFFARQVLPLVREQIPDCVFNIYGSEMEKMREPLDDLREDGGINLVGYVNNISEVLDRHRVFATPVRYGSGIKGKLVMGLCNGIPAVVTRMATEGMDVRDGQEVVFADAPAEFAAAAVALHQDAKKWQAISERALAFGRRAFSAEGAHEVMRQAVLASGVPV
jgi:GT2 family glycosyltransferase